MNITTKQFLDNPDYLESVKILLQLHALIAIGQGDSDEADAVRDASEKPWYQLNEAEQMRVRVLSANLDMLIEDEVFRPVPPEQRTCEWLEPRIEAARQAQDWDAVLALLRNGPDYLTTEELASQRADAYEQLGHPDIALLFADYARRKNPKATDESVLERDLLLRSA